MREEAMARSVAALAALRGQVSAEQIQTLVRKQQRRAKTKVLQFRKVFTLRN
jgi:hypothetical protein